MLKEFIVCLYMYLQGGFQYSYGWSFFTAGVGFLASEMAAVVGVTLFLNRYEQLVLPDQLLFLYLMFSKKD
jgi:hypothetical protein